MQLEYVASDYGYGIGNTDWTIITPSTPGFFPVLSKFTQVYGFIKNTNVIISRIDDITWDDQADRNKILGIALFYRSWWYYRLITSYGDVPFIGYELKGPKLDFYTHSRWTILEKIIQDVEFAVQSLPETSIAGEVNKYVALHFLSKLYLANSQFDKAIEAANSVINGPYQLMTERFGSDAGNADLNVLWDLHRPENKSIATNKESIWTVIDRVSAPDNAKTFSYTMRGYHSQWWYTRVLDSQGKQGMVASGPQYFALGRANSDAYMSPWFAYDVWNEF
ncbi:MAG: RagB/SusD family nutrient uptake outer membrane protein, partial [Syntrophomonadaceae bacterium]|nr:RagB/SusD family nutrient uptake outer membrane protein [Syntrophomonadaceae bacterium]